MQYCYFESPVGPLLLAGSESCLISLSFSNGKSVKQPLPTWQYNPTVFANCVQQLQEYFAGTRQAFDLPYKLQCSVFRQMVLQRVAAVPYGTTENYSDIAIQLNNPKAVRAVGMANARNALPIIIPCHRIIGKNGSLTGFAGGLAIKSYLLDLERSACR